MPPKHKSSHRYLIVLTALTLYMLGLIIAAIALHVDHTWLFYGLIPSAISIGVALYAYQEAHYRDIHTDQYLHRIATDMSDVKTYVAEMAGVKQEVDF